LPVSYFVLLLVKLCILYLEAIWISHNLASEEAQITTYPAMLCGCLLHSKKRQLQLQERVLSPIFSSLVFPSKMQRVICHTGDNNASELFAYQFVCCQVQLHNLNVPQWYRGYFRRLLRLRMKKNLVINARLLSRLVDLHLRRILMLRISNSFCKKLWKRCLKGRIQRQIDIKTADMDNDLLEQSYNYSKHLKLLVW